MWHTKLHPKRAKVCDLCHLYHSFISQNLRINFVWSHICQIHHNYKRLDVGHCDVTGHRKVLGTAGAMVTSHENSVMMWSFKGSKLFCILQNLLEIKKEWWASHCGVVYKLNFISNFSRITDWSAHSGSYFFHSTFAVSTNRPLRR